MAPLPSTIIVQTPIQCSADEFYKFFKQRATELVQACGFIVQKVEPDNGGCKIYIVTSPCNPTEVIKVHVDAIDNSSRKITYEVLDGPILQWYTPFQVTLESLEIADGSAVKWTLQYEKKDGTIGEPGCYAGLLPNINHAVSAYLLSNTAK